MAKHKFIVIKGKNNIVGKHGLVYEIYDTITIKCSDSDVQKEQRKYVYHNLFYVDNKHKPLRFRRDVTCRRRHLMMKNNKIFATIKIFDFEDGTYYGFIPANTFDF